MTTPHRPAAQPDCPKCGCFDVTRLPDEHWHVSTITCRCNHCYTKFDFRMDGHAPDGPEPVAIFVRTACPHCRSDNTIVTRGPVGTEKHRRHDCRECGMKFTSRQL
jgi:hypothetical protein